MKKILFLTTIIILILSANAFGQPKRKKTTVLPEVGDEVLVTLRKKQAQTKTSKQNSPKRKVKQFFDEADALFGKNHEPQNQLVFEPNDEQLWAKIKQTSSTAKINNQRRISVRKKN